MKIEYEYSSSLTKILDLCLWIHTNYDVYEGNWVENFRHGIGKIVYKDKGTYYGEWSKGKAQYQISVQLNIHIDSSIIKL